MFNKPINLLSLEFENQNGVKYNILAFDNYTNMCLLQHTKENQYVVCTELNPKEKKWKNGNYFSSEAEARKFYVQKQFNQLEYIDKFEIVIENERPEIRNIEMLYDAFMKHETTGLMDGDLINKLEAVVEERLNLNNLSNDEFIIDNFKVEIDRYGELFGDDEYYFGYKVIDVYTDKIVADGQSSVEVSDDNMSAIKNEMIKNNFYRGKPHISEISGLLKDCIRGVMESESGTYAIQDEYPTQEELSILNEQLKKYGLLELVEVDTRSDGAVDIFCYGSLADVFDIREKKQPLKTNNQDKENISSISLSGLEKNKNKVAEKHPIAMLDKDKEQIR